MSTDTGTFAMHRDKQERAVAFASPAVVARILGQRPTYERAVSHCIVVDLRTGERTVTHQEPIGGPPKKALPSPKPAAHVVPVDPEPFWQSELGKKQLLSREKVPVGEPIPAGDIMRAVAVLTDISIEAMRGPCRARRLSHPRQMAMVIVSELRPDLSTTQIGVLFGNKDHTTVLHARKVVRQRIAEHLPSAKLYEAVKVALRRETTGAAGRGVCE